MSTPPNVFLPQTLDDLTQDAHNANRGTNRGRAALAASLRQLGAGRSVLVDREGRIIAGNKTVQAALAEGGIDLVVVQTDGTKLVAVQRTDLSLAQDDAAKALAVADNRTAQLDLDWDPGLLATLASEGVDLVPFFTDDEIRGLKLDADEEKRHAHGARKPARAPSGPPAAGAGPPLLVPDDDPFAPAPLAPEARRAKLNDVWLLGTHKLTVGQDGGSGIVDRLLEFWERETGRAALLITGGGPDADDAEEEDE